MKQERFHGFGSFSPPSRRHCEACAQERIFQNFKCLTCGAIRARIPHQKKRFYHTGKERLARLKLIKQGNRDKAAFLAKQAEESRAKFEGAK